MELIKAAGGSDFSIFLAADWTSISSGEAWYAGVLRELRSCDELIALITSKETFSNPWINFEIGVFAGRSKNPKIFVFGGILPWDGFHTSGPIPHSQLTDTGDTNRWMNDFKEIGIQIDEQTYNELRKLFRQIPAV